MDQHAHKSQWPSYFQFRVYDYIMVRCIIRFIDTQIHQLLRFLRSSCPMALRLSNRHLARIITKSSILKFMEEVFH